MMLSFTDDSWTPIRSSVGNARLLPGNVVFKARAARSTVKLLTEQMSATFEQSPFGYSLVEWKHTDGPAFGSTRRPLWMLAVRDVAAGHVTNAPPPTEVVVTGPTSTDIGSELEFEWTLSGFAKGGQIVVTMKIVALHNDSQLQFSVNLQCSTAFQAYYAVASLFFPSFAISPLVSSGTDVFAVPRAGGACTKNPTVNLKYPLYGITGGVPDDWNWCYAGKFPFTSIGGCPSLSTGDIKHPGWAWFCPWVMYGDSVSKELTMFWFKDEAGSWPKNLKYHAEQDKLLFEFGFWFDGDSEIGNIGASYDIPVTFHLRAWKASTKWVEAAAAEYWRSDILTQLRYYPATIKDRHDAHGSVKDARIAFTQESEWGGLDPDASPGAPDSDYSDMLTNILTWKAHFAANSGWTPEYAITHLQRGPHRHGWNIRLGEEPLLRANDNVDYPNWSNLVAKAFGDGIYYMLYYIPLNTDDEFPIPFSGEASFNFARTASVNGKDPNPGGHGQWMLCPGDDVARASWIGICKAWKDIGMGVYNDTYGVYSTTPCRMTSHPDGTHPVGGCHWWNEKIAGCFEEISAHDGILPVGLGNCNYAEYSSDFNMRWTLGCVWVPESENELAIPQSTQMKYGAPEYRYYLPLSLLSVGPRFWCNIWGGHVTNRLSDPIYHMISLDAMLHSMIYRMCQSIHNGTKLGITNVQKESHGLGTRSQYIYDTLLEDSKWDELTGFLTNWVTSFEWLGDYVMNGYLMHPIDDYTVGRGTLEYHVYSYTFNERRLYSNTDKLPEAVSHSVWRHHEEGSLVLLLTNWNGSQETWSGDWRPYDYGVDTDFTVDVVSWPDGDVADSVDYSAKSTIRLSHVLAARGGVTVIRVSPRNGLRPGQAHSGSMPPATVWGKGQEEDE